MRLGFDPKDGGNGPTYIRNGGGMYGEMDGCKDGWTDSPCVQQDLIAIGVSAQKHPSSAYSVNERLLLSGHLHEMPDSVQLLLRDVIYLRCHRS